MKEIKPFGNPSSMFGGWVLEHPDAQGMVSPRKQSVNSTMPEFSKFAGSMRARWDLMEYIKVKLQQHFRKNK
jgi:hypothetical protein